MAQQCGGELGDAQLFWSGNSPTVNTTTNTVNLGTLLGNGTALPKGNGTVPLEASSQRRLSECLFQIAEAEHALQLARSSLFAAGADSAGLQHTPVQMAVSSHEEPTRSTSKPQLDKTSPDRDTCLSDGSFQRQLSQEEKRRTALKDQVVLPSTTEEEDDADVLDEWEDCSGRHVGEHGSGTDLAYQEASFLDHEVAGDPTNDGEFVLSNIGEFTDEAGEKKPERFLIDPHKIVWVRCGCCHLPVFHPDSDMRMIWNVFGFIFIVFEAFLIPFYMAFNYQATGLMLGFISLVNVYFMGDVVMSFFTGFMEDGVPECRLKCIAIRYSRTWLIPDIVSGIPWEWITLPDDSHYGEAFKSLRFIKAFRLLRMARLLQLMRKGTVSSAVEVVIESNRAFVFAAGLLKLLFFLFAVTHWAACYWFIVGTNPTADEKRTWISDNIDGVEDVAMQYIYSIYFTLTTMTTVGYGDITATNGSEVKFVLVLLLVASVVFAGLMGALTDLITSLNSEANEQNARKASLSRYMRWRALPKHLFMQVREHLLFLWERNEFDEAYEDEIKEQLSPSLRKELCYHVYGGILRHAPFLAWMKGCEVCLKELATKVVTVFLVKGDNLFHVGELNENIYTLLKGTLYLSQNENLSLFQGIEDSLYATVNAFEIPRNKESSMADVFKMLTGVSRRSGHKKLSRYEESMKERSRLIVDMMLRSSGTSSAAKDDEESESEDGLPDQDFLSRSIDSSQLYKAARKLHRLDIKRHEAAIRIQRRWKRREGVLFLASFGRRPAQPKPKNDSVFKTKWVSAPAYLGESCLWQPVSDWDLESSIVKQYAAKAETRVELAYFTRGAVQDILERFSPWLGDRLTFFQNAVRENMKDTCISEPAGIDGLGDVAKGQVPRIMVGDNVASDFAAQLPCKRSARSTPRATPREGLTAGGSARYATAATPRTSRSTARDSPSLPSSSGGRFRNAAAAALARVHKHVTPPPGVSPRTEARMIEAQASGSLFEPFLPSEQRAKLRH